MRRQYKFAPALAISGVALLSLSACSGAPGRPAATHHSKIWTLTRSLPVLPQTEAITVPSTKLAMRVGAGDKSYDLGDVGTKNLVLQIVCDGPGKVTVLQQTVGPCVGYGAWTDVIPWNTTPADLRVTVQASSKTAWSIYVAAES